MRMCKKEEEEMTRKYKEEEGNGELRENDGT